ncbi:hypothetical protein VTH06DRAFT_4985 [Thermothelomyces fergusii]
MQDWDQQWGLIISIADSVDNLADTAGPITSDNNQAQHLSHHRPLSIFISSSRIIQAPAPHPLHQGQTAPAPSAHQIGASRVRMVLELGQQPLRWHVWHRSPSSATRVVQPWVEKWAQGLSAMPEAVLLHNELGHDSIVPDAMPSSLVTAFIYERYETYRTQGLGYEELIPFDVDVTIDALRRALEANGHEVVAVEGIQQLVGLVAAGKHREWDLAFPIAEGMFGGAGREAQVPGILEAYQIPHVFADAATLSLAQNKALTKMVLDHHGIPTAPFAVVPPAAGPPGGGDGRENQEDVGAAVAEALAGSRHAAALGAFPLFIKPAWECSSKGIDEKSRVGDAAELVAGVRRLRARYPGQGVLVERFLGGAEYSVSVLGTGPSACAVGTALLDWDAARSPPVLASRYHVPYWARGAPPEGHDYPVRVVSPRDDPAVRMAEEVALRAWRAVGCRDVGRVDFRLDTDGLPYVLEINAIPGLRPSWSTLTKTAEFYGIDYNHLIGAVVESALERYPHLRSKSESAELRN